jgi:hypothetical protein
MKNKRFFIYDKKLIKKIKNTKKKCLLKSKGKYFWIKI